MKKLTGLHVDNLQGMRIVNKEGKGKLHAKTRSRKGAKGT